MGKWFYWVLPIFVVGCGPYVDATQQARTQLVGLSERDLIACAGEPDARSPLIGKEQLTYVLTERHRNLDFSCKADFIVYRGHVEHVSYRGIERPVFGPETPCINIVSQCLQ